MYNNYIIVILLNICICRNAVLLVSGMPTCRQIIYLRQHSALYMCQLHDTQYLYHRSSNAGYYGSQSHDIQELAQDLHPISSK